MDTPQPPTRPESHVIPYQQQKRARIFPTTMITLTSLSMVSCVIVLGIAIALAVDPALQSYIPVWTAPQAGVALLWSALELITAYVPTPTGSNRRTIHPAALVAVHLLLWLGFAVGVGLTAYVLQYGLVFVGPDDRDAYPDVYDYYYDDKDGDDYDYYSNFYIHSMEALVAFLALLM